MEEEEEDQSSKKRKKGEKTKNGESSTATVTAQEDQPSLKTEKGESSTATVTGQDVEKIVQPTVKQRSHHAVRTSPVCQQHQANLKRHLGRHVKKGEIKEGEVDKLVSIAAKMGECRGPPKKGSQA